MKTGSPFCRSYWMRTPRLFIATSLSHVTLWLRRQPKKSLCGLALAGEPSARPTPPAVLRPAHAAAILVGKLNIWIIPRVTTAGAEPRLASPRGLGGDQGNGSAR